jgi:hypothetical protein
MFPSGPPVMSSRLLRFPVCSPALNSVIWPSVVIRPIAGDADAP